MKLTKAQAESRERQLLEQLAAIQRRALEEAEPLQKELTWLHMLKPLPPFVAPNGTTFRYDGPSLYADE